MNCDIWEWIALVVVLLIIITVGTWLWELFSGHNSESINNPNIKSSEVK